MPMSSCIKRANRFSIIICCLIRYRALIDIVILVVFQTVAVVPLIHPQVDSFHDEFGRSDQICVFVELRTGTAQLSSKGA